MTRTPCIVCKQPTHSTAEMVHEGSLSTIYVCDSCRNMAAALGLGGRKPRNRWARWLPRVGWCGTTLCFDWGEAEGCELFLIWGALHLKFTIAWGRP